MLTLDELKIWCEEELYTEKANHKETIKYGRGNSVLSGWHMGAEEVLTKIIEIIEKGEIE